MFQATGRSILLVMEQECWRWTMIELFCLLGISVTYFPAIFLFVCLCLNTKLNTLFNYSRLHQILRETGLFCQHDTLLIQDYDNRTTRLHSYIWRNSRLEKKHRLFDFHTDKTTSMEHKLRNYH